MLAEREEELRTEKMKNKTLADGIKETLGTSENSPSPVKIPKLGEFDRGRTPATRASPRPSRSPSSGRRSTAADRTSRGRSVVPRSPRRRSRSRRPPLNIFKLCLLLQSFLTTDYIVRYSLCPRPRRGPSRSSCRRRRRTRRTSASRWPSSNP